MSFPVRLLAGLAAVVGNFALRTLPQRGAPALLAAEEAAKQLDPQDGFVALRLYRAGLLLLRRCRVLLRLVRFVAAGQGPGVVLKDWAGRVAVGRPKERIHI